MGTCEGRDIQVYRLPLTETYSAAPRPYGLECDHDWCERARRGEAPCPPGKCELHGPGRPKAPCPHDPPGLAWSALPRGLRAAREQALGRIVEPLRGLVRELHGAVEAGALGPDELGALRDLQLWLGRLIAEQEVAKEPAPAAPAKPRGRKKQPRE